MQLLTRKKKMLSLNILWHSLTQNIFYRFGYVDGKIVLLQKLSENFSHCCESQKKKIRKSFLFLSRFRALKSTDILWSHECTLKKTRQSVTKLVFDWHAMCVLAKNWLVLRMTFLQFFFVLVQASYCQCTCVNNLMQTAAQFSKKNKWKIPCIYW